VIEKCQQSEFMMERLRRQSQQMSRDELLVVVDTLSRLYCTTKAGANWLVKEAARNMAANC
jgi:photosystem II stability/assembly factor-like uncharacterized protein